MLGEKIVMMQESHMTETRYICPITREVMENPVVAADGFSYELAAIRVWLSEHNASPITREVLAHKNLTPNLHLKSLIAEFKAQQQAQLQQKVGLAQQLLLEIQQQIQCFENYERLSMDCKQRLIGKVGEAAAQQHWDNKLDLAKDGWLKSLGLNSYSFLKMEFRQYISECTQTQRHEVSPHPSTESFWGSHFNLHEAWFAGFKPNLPLQLIRIKASYGAGLENSNNVRARPGV